MQITPFWAFIIGVAVSGVAFATYGTYLIRRARKRMLAQTLFSIVFGGELAKEEEQCRKKKTG